jgi:hypothetical protein
MRAEALRREQPKKNKQSLLNSISRRIERWLYDANKRSYNE